MNSDLPPASSTSSPSGIACASCGTVDQDSVVTCMHCRADRTWLASAPFRNVLTVDEGAFLDRTGEIALTIEWEWQSASRQHWGRIRSGENGTFRAGNVEWTLRQTATGELAVSDSATEIRTRLPCLIAIDGGVLRAREILTARGMPTLRALDHPVGSIDVSGSGIAMGAGRKCQVPLPDATLFPVHAHLWRDTSKADLWIGAATHEAKIFVNGIRVLTARLEGGDLLQIGCYAFVYSEGNRTLVPILRQSGVRLLVSGLQTRNSPSRVDLEIPTGQFVVLTGPSGSGKSTLLKALAGLPGYCRSGSIAVGDRDFSRCPGPGCHFLGYVPQQLVVHEELSPQEILASSARLRGSTASKEVVENVLQLLDLPPRCWRRSLRQLSGGEQKRVCTAAELVASPRLLLLDEPGSGLDEDREVRLMRLLRSLSHLGCTVITVIHNLEMVGYADRVLEMNHGKIVRDCCSMRFLERRSQRQNGSGFEAPTRWNTDCHDHDARPDDRAALRLKPAPRGMWQWRLLLQREWTISLRDWPRRLAVPLVLMPVVFALVLGIAIPGHRPRLLSYFAVLAVIWMGASLGILAICGERRVFDHERHLFLRIPAYLGAKMTLLGGIGGIQTVLFAAALTFVRTILGFESLAVWPAATACLILVSVSAIALGLSISAFAHRSSSMANFLLPLVMVAQIVFSSVICVGSDRATVEEAYGEFPKGFVRQADSFRSDSKGITEPSQLSGYLSGLTLSRYGDVLLLALNSVSSGIKDQAEVSRWTSSLALCNLAGLGACFVVVAGELMRRQDRR